MRNLVNKLMSNNVVVSNNSEYTRVESFWSKSPSEYHSIILRAGIIMSVKDVLALYNNARGLFFLPISGIKNVTNDKVCNLIIALHQGVDIVNDDSVYFGHIAIYKTIK